MILAPAGRQGLFYALGEERKTGFLDEMSRNGDGF